MKNRTILGLLCIGAALAVSFGAAPLVSRLSDSREDILRIRHDLPAGHCLTADDIEQVTVGSYHLPPETLRKPEEAVGRYAACDLKAQDSLLPSKLTDRADRADDIFRTLDDGHAAVSITIPTFAGGLSARLQNGDIVRLFVHNTETGETIQPETLRYVRVITSTTADGLNRDELLQKEDGSYELPTTLTLLASPVQIRDLIRYENTGRMHAVLLCRDNAEKARAFLEEQDKLLAAEDDPAVQTQEAENG